VCSFSKSYDTQEQLQVKAKWLFIILENKSRNFFEAGGISCYVGDLRPNAPSTNKATTTTACVVSTSRSPEAVTVTH
jgi:hypothetical protein